MPRHAGPLLTHDVATALNAAHAARAPSWHGSLDLGRTHVDVPLSTKGFGFAGADWPWPGRMRERTVYYWSGAAWAPVQRFDGALVKLVPTEWGPPTFEIGGIKMLPTARVSPWIDAERKVALIEPRGKQVLDTCGGLGYFAAACLVGGAAQVQSFEKSDSVLWLRTINPWSPDPDAPEAAGRLSLVRGDVSACITSVPDASFDAALHDPPRFGIAGELYSQAFYDQLARVLRRGAPLFHYTGTPNRLTSGRDVPREVARRLERAGFRTRLVLDGVFATR